MSLETLPLPRWKEHELNDHMRAFTLSKWAKPLAEPALTALTSPEWGFQRHKGARPPGEASASLPSLPRSHPSLFPSSHLCGFTALLKIEKKIAQVRKLKNETLHYCAFSKTPRSESGWAGDTEQGKGTQLRTVKKYRREIHSWTCATSLMDVMSSLYKKSFDDLRALWQCL